MRIRDWSSDVCSSDLPPGEKGAGWEWLFKPKGLDSDFHFSAPFQGQFTPFWCDAWRVQRSLKVNGFCVAEDEIFFPKGPRDRRYRIAIAESCALDRKRVVSGQIVSVRVDLGGRRILNKHSHYDSPALHALVYLP